jgi:hypothetical protein
LRNRDFGKAYGLGLPMDPWRDYWPGSDRNRCLRQDCVSGSGDDIVLEPDYKAALKLSRAKQSTLPGCKIGSIPVLLDPGKDLRIVRYLKVS